MDGQARSASVVATVKSELSYGRPFIFRWGWTSGGGHFLVGHGITSTDTMLYYMDPWFGNGLSIAQYSWVVSGDDHTWTHTNQINTNPAKPNVPVLSSPANHSTLQPLTVAFEWRKCDRITNYKLQVSEYSNFSSYFVNDSTLTDTLKIVNGLKLYTYYYWRVCGKNASGNSNYSDVFDFRTSSSGINIINTNIPDNFRLYQNYPNPFNPETSIKYQVTKTSNVKLIIFDVLGNEVATLVNEKQSPGTYEVNWNVAHHPSGIYLYRLIAGDFQDTKRMILLK